MLQCIPLTDLVDMWQKDSVVDSTEPGVDMLRIPQLHSKYCTQITAHTIALKMKRFDLAKKKKLKIDYYSGRLNGTQQLKDLGWEPFPFVLKTDINSYLESDDDLIDIQKKMINNEEAITFCTAVCKEINNRTWQIKEFMAWQRFQVGQ
jgi:Recombination, repair and ssDNA binding protein UvsY